MKVRFIVGIAFLVAACTPAGRELAIVRGLDVAKCVMENQDEDEVKVLARCAAENVSPDDIKRILSEAKAATAKAAAKRVGCPPAVPSSSGSK